MVVIEKQILCRPWWDSPWRRSLIYVHNISMWDFLSKFKYLTDWRANEPLTLCQINSDFCRLLSFFKTYLFQILSGVPSCSLTVLIQTRPYILSGFLRTADNTSRQRISFCVLNNFACSFVVCWFFFKIKCSSGIPSMRQNKWRVITVHQM